MENYKLPEGVKKLTKHIENKKHAFTKGPWAVDHNGVITGDSGLASVAETYLIKVEAAENIRMINEARANGILISFAPELIEALEAAAHALEIAAGQLLDFETSMNYEPYCHTSAINSVAKARLTIKKAKGEI